VNAKLTFLPLVIACPSCPKCGTRMIPLFLPRRMLTIMRLGQPIQQQQLPRAVIPLQKRTFGCWARKFGKLGLAEVVSPKSDQ